MRVGDLVKLKSIPTSIGLISWVSPNVHESISYDVTVVWSTPNRHGQITDQFNFQLEVMSESR